MEKQWYRGFNSGTAILGVDEERRPFPRDPEASKDSCFSKMPTKK
jgi:hypothetical protein